MVDIVNQNDKTICLNMIVKNESHIIAYTLKNILKHIKIDYWVISDTGSTDDTVDIIQDFFKERGISGEMFHDVWTDFGHNRTKALEHAYDKSDYLFIFDADDLIHGDIPLPSLFDKDLYNVSFGNPVSYHRPILISNRMKWKYVGVLHESLVHIDPIKSDAYLLGNYHIESRRLGDRSKNPNKYVDDALILEKGFEEENTDMWLKYRYSYYCAQSYHDAGKLEKAIEWYERTLTLDYSPQYKYCACIKAGDCYNALKQYSNAIDSWSNAYTYDRERLEGIVKIMEYFYNKRQYFMVSSLYNKFKHVKIGNAKDKIFLDYSKYHDFHYFASISGCYCDEHKSAYEACKYMLLNNRPNSANTIYNLKFYMKHFKEDGDNKSLLDYFVTYIMNEQIVFKERKDAWNIVNSIIKEQLPEKYNLLENSMNIIRIDKNNKYSSSKKILIYTSWMTREWNEEDLNTGLGGSESAVVNITKEFDKSNEIYVCGYVKEGVFDNVSYIKENKLQNMLDNTEFAVIIISRFINFLSEYKNIKCNKLILSLHDTDILCTSYNTDKKYLLKEYINYIDKVIVLTEYHKSVICYKYPILKDKFVIINNGINPSQFPKQIDKIKNKFIYTSCSSRGLERLLELWPNILKHIPNATLDISSYENFPKDNFDYGLLNTIDQHTSITHKGKLGKTDLYNMMSLSEYWLYPTHFCETSCITALEMMMNNVLCIYYPVGALNDTIGNYGIPVNKGEEINAIMNISTEKKVLMRENARKYAIQCSWNNRFREWNNVLKLYPNVEVWDYSKSNIHIGPVNGDDIQEQLYLPYKSSENELNSLIRLNKNTKKEYDFGILKTLKNVTTERREKIVNFLRKHNFTVNIIGEWNDDRHAELAKCKLILNIHGNDDITSHSFEHIICDRLLDTGFNILSEESVNIDPSILNNYPNLQVIHYDEFFNIAKIIEYYNNKLGTVAHNNYVLDILQDSHARFNIPSEHIKYLEKISKEFQPNNMIIYDIGSSVLHWTQHAKNLWKNSKIYLFDGMTEMKLFYDEYNKLNKTNYEYNVGVLCDEDYKRISFYQNDKSSGGNSYYKEIGHKDSHTIFTENHIKHKIGMKLETIVKNKNIPFPDLIKIDVQGAELDILKGSMSIINHAKFLIVELQHTQYNEGAPMCNTTCDFLIENGWQVHAEKFCNNGPDADWCFINTNNKH